MKTSRAKSFRLHHIGKTSQMRRTSQSFMEPSQTFKLAALNTVTRGVKLADLSVMTGNDLNKLRKEPNQPKNGEELSAHCNLMQVRQRYDEMKKKNDRCQLHIAQQKEQINKLEIFKSELEGKQEKSKSVANELQQKLTDIKVLLDETSTEYKVLRNIQVRQKADKVVYDQRKFDQEQLLNHKRTQLSIYRKEGMTEQVSFQRTNKVYQQLQDQLAAEQIEREKHILNLENMIEEKMALINVNSLRENELGEIASRAIQDKMQSEKSWRMIYLTHSFVNKMLRDKIDSEMMKFKTVEFAFKTIKTATGVSDAKTLVSKYLNKDSVYGELLGKIADNQRVISDLKTEGDQLALQTKQLQAEKEVLQNTKTKELDLHDNIKEYQFQDDKSILTYSLAKKLSMWVQRQCKKLSIVTGQAEKPSEGFCEGTKQFLNNLSTLLDTVEGQTIYKEEGPLGHAEKVVRVMPKRSRKNSAGEQIFDVDEEEVNPHSNHEEAEFINNQHDDLLHANDRFMKELKRKVEQSRREFVEQQMKAKAPVKAPEVKKEEE